MVGFSTRALWLGSISDRGEPCQAWRSRTDKKVVRIRRRSTSTPCFFPQAPWAPGSTAVRQRLSLRRLQCSHSTPASSAGAWRRVSAECSSHCSSNLTARRGNVTDSAAVRPFT